MNNSKIRIAVIGGGGWGREHMRVFTSRSDTTVCAVATRNQNTAEARASQYGARAYSDIGTMLEKERPDLVSICLPNQLHFEPTLQMIRAGYPLLVEKPLVFDLNEADTLLREAAERKLFFAINFNHRYAKPIAMAKEAITAGHLGEITFATWRFGGEGPADHPFNNLIETQCHGFDALEFLVGPAKSIMAQMTEKARAGSFTTMSIAMEFQNGAVGSLVGSYDSSYAYPNTHMLEINGTRGRVWIEDTVAKYAFHPAGSELGQTWQAGYFNDRDRTFVQTFDRYADAMLEAFKAGQPPPVHASAGRRALALADAAIRSHRTGTRISI